MSEQPDLKPVLDRISSSVADFLQREIRRAYDRGLSDGRKQARDRIVAALESDAPAKALPPAKNVLPRGYYADAVRDALRALCSDGRAVRPDDVLAYVHSQPGGESVDIDQVRTALKVLTRQREASRKERGLYTAPVAQPNLIQ